jgi:hypothetical protein
MNPLFKADRELIADLAAVVGLYVPTNQNYLIRKWDVLARATQRLSEPIAAQGPKRHRWHWCKWLLLRGDQ